MPSAFGAFCIELGIDLKQGSSQLSVTPIRRYAVKCIYETEYSQPQYLGIGSRAATSNYPTIGFETTDGQAFFSERARLQVVCPPVNGELI